MGFMVKLLIAFILVTIGLVLLLMFKNSLTRGVGGKILAFIVLFLLPVMLLAGGVFAHYEKSKSNEFCLSCHAMEPYGKSLNIDDSDYLPAAHFQNNRVPQENACYTCHTSYTMFGGLKSKLEGLKHVYVYYLGNIPDKIELYEPYENRGCLYCHDGARSYEENMMHADMLDELIEDETSCLDCHSLTHNIEELADLKLWRKGEKE
ncbi:hypothetical protein LCGC14_1633250 [marine sediment metagenome]|uniref:NapC/NirT cytochrome c N-terminal domain-containing protein n=1 Tax=marine sediment metagenome TaxID=412755 RepID=A0A0F9IPA1_9ZZZZ|nr:hypothetical protein [Spirochaetota bacterium]